MSRLDDGPEGLADSLLGLVHRLQRTAELAHRMADHPDRLDVPYDTWLADALLGAVAVHLRLTARLPAPEAPEPDPVVEVRPRDLLR